MALNSSGCRGALNMALPTTTNTNTKRQTSKTNNSDLVASRKGKQIWSIPT